MASLYKYVDVSFDFKVNVDANALTVAWCHLSDTLKSFKEIVNYNVTGFATNSDESQRFFTEILLELSLENREMDLESFKERLSSRVGKRHQLEKFGQIYFLSRLSGINLI